MEMLGKSQSKCKSILIVEDEKDIREALRDVLEFEGYSVSCASNGQEALEILLNLERPCLILLDLMMPIMNGWQFIQSFREHDFLATIPVVIVSAYGDKGCPQPTQGFVKKPVDLEALYKFVKTYCT